VRDPAKEERRRVLAAKHYLETRFNEEVPKIDKEGAATTYIRECRRREPASVDKEQENWAVLYVTSRPITTPRHVTTRRTYMHALRDLRIHTRAC
jgi:hypothetical protein